MSLEYARTILKAEVCAIQSVIARLGGSVVSAIELVLAHPTGRVVTCGIGKAGIIAQKVSATLSSTGTSSFFLHPADALHGDLGMTRDGDILLVFSNSGESEEISRLLPFVRRQGLSILAITGSTRSTLGVQADLVLELGDLQEACPLGLAPTASTTAMLALGDAFAMALMKRRNFSATEYAALHPAGELGRKALSVREVMRIGDSAAIVDATTPLLDVIQRITDARAGAAAVVDSAGALLGIFTDGDLRRYLLKHNDDLSTRVDALMTPDPVAIRSDAPAAEALALLREHRIGEMPVLDESNCVIGLVDLKGILAAGLA